MGDNLRRVCDASRHHDRKTSMFNFFNGPPRRVPSRVSEYVSESASDSECVCAMCASDSECVRARAIVCASYSVCVCVCVRASECVRVTARDDWSESNV